VHVVSSNQHDGRSHRQIASAEYDELVEFLLELEDRQHRIRVAVEDGARLLFVLVAANTAMQTARIERLENTPAKSRPRGRPKNPPFDRGALDKAARLRSTLQLPVRRVTKLFRNQELDTAELAQTFTELLQQHLGIEGANARAHGQRLASLVAKKQPPRSIVPRMVQIACGLPLNVIARASRS
jgi:hypothetical protein